MEVTGSEIWNCIMIYVYMNLLVTEIFGATQGVWASFEYERLPAS
jgi:hypothetical protein